MRTSLNSILLTFFVSVSAQALTVNHLQVEGQDNPLIIDTTSPTFSWQLQSDHRCVVQTAYQLTVYSDADCQQPIYDTGMVESRQSVDVAPGQLPLQPSTRYYWRVSVTDNTGEQATSTEQATFTTGLLTADGLSPAQWIKATTNPIGTPAPEVVTDYTISLRFRILHNAAGIAFAKHEGENFYMWQFNTEGNRPRFRPHRWSNGNASCMEEIDINDKLSAANPSATFSPDDWHSLRIEVTNNGTHARTLLDDIVIDNRDGQFEYGQFGFRESQGNDNREEDALFDDITITTPTGNTLFTEDFATSNSFSAGRLEDGALRVIGSTGDHILAWQATDNKLHYTVEADLTILRDNIGIVFSAIGMRTFHIWQINTYDRARPLLRHHLYHLYYQPQFNDVEITQFSKSDLLNHQHRVKIEVKGTTVYTYIDDTLVDTYVDQSGHLAFGDIGFRVDNKSPFHDSAYIDNIVVTQYDADGTPHITLAEDFEQPSSPYFHNATIVEVNGSRQFYMADVGAEHRIMQTPSQGAPVFIRSFQARSAVQSAMLYSTALGIYDLHLNGTRIGHIEADGSTSYEELKPGRTDYNHRVNYQQHDITTLLNEGENTLTATVTNGWWRGEVAHGAYGNPDPAFMAKLVITYRDGTTDIVCTDDSWTCSTDGPVRLGDIYNGEVYDARLSATPKYAVELSTDFKGTIEAPLTAPIQQQPQLTLHPVSATVYLTPQANPSGDYGMVEVIDRPAATSAISLQRGKTLLFDFGQNFSGVVSFKTKGRSGTQLHFRHAEMLNDNGSRSRGNDGPGGSPYLNNLRTATADLSYTLAGRPEGESYQATHTFFGFRYCTIETTDDVEILSVEGVPLQTTMRETGNIETSHPDVNQLFSNIQWGQRSNFIGIPTDCPQRDERLGWTADVQLFSPTALFNADARNFYRHWMQTMRDGQRNDGAYPNVSPFEDWDGYGAAAWSDAGIVVPYNTYMMTGDKAVLRENFASMERYMNWLAKQTGDGYRYQGAGTTFGDWLAFAGTDSRYVSVAYYALDAQLMARMAQALSERSTDTYARKVKQYQTLYQNIKAEFRTRYITPTIRQTSQTAYLMALAYNLLDGDTEINDFKNQLSQAIANNGYKLSTGFLGTAIINPTLSRFGLNDYAYDLLLQRQCPSWLYSVDQGATTTWERWDSYTRERGFGDATMNSFNHYAYGAVGEWMYRYMAGINYDEEQPGFKHIVLQPSPDRRTTLPGGQQLITSCTGSHISPYGKIESTWKTIGEKGLDYTCTIPANTTATLRLPAADANLLVIVDGQPASAVEGVTLKGYEDGCLVYELGSGTWHFSTDGTTSISPLSASPQVGGEGPVYDLQGRKIADKPSSLILHPKRTSISQPDTSL